jgi:hypothetical protein
MLRGHCELTYIDVFVPNTDVLGGVTKASPVRRSGWDRRAVRRVTRPR